MLSKTLVDPDAEFTSIVYDPILKQLYVGGGFIGVGNVPANW
jgi:hypothetical protein